MRNSPAWIIALTTLLASGCVTNAPVEPPPVSAPQTITAPLVVDETAIPTYKVGDRWEYSDGYGLEVTRLEGGLATMTLLENSNAITNEWLQRRGIFTESRKTGDEFRQVVFRSRFPEKDLFPLAIGRKTSYKREFLLNNKELREHQTTWNVVGRDTIEVPAGRFDVWVMDYESQSITTDWYGRERWYYSPQARQYVRMEYQYGKAPASSRVLMKYRLTP